MTYDSGVAFSLLFSICIYMQMARFRMHDPSEQYVFTRREGMVFVRVNMHDSSEQFVFTCREGMGLTRINMHDSSERYVLTCG